jgi:hypothetical protein
MCTVDFVVSHSTIVGRSRRLHAQRATETTEGLEENAHEGHGHVDRDDQNLKGPIWAWIDLVPRAATPGEALHDRQFLALEDGGHHEAGGCAPLARLDDGALDRIDHVWMTGSAAPLPQLWRDGFAWDMTNVWRQAFGWSNASMQSCP